MKNPNCPVCGSEVCDCHTGTIREKSKLDNKLRAGFEVTEVNDENDQSVVCGVCGIELDPNDPEDKKILEAMELLKKIMEGE